ncbi:MAG: RES family NAD+ phosphorylase [Actinobacteria bacterium]|nr:RES family NAD+ phosphorylase [Actinomycetota bacterium]
MDDELPRLVAAGKVTSVTGRWQRHCGARYAGAALDGRIGDGRWGTRTGFPVLYLGHPLDSVIVEAYRHLIDPIEDDDERAALTQNLAPRALVTATVSVTNILDLRDVRTRAELHLTADVLRCPTNDTDGYAACQHVAQVAHQLGLHGILAPAATDRGQTLALFTDLLPAGERPTRDEPDQMWNGLPADPRQSAAAQLRIVRDPRST